MGAVIVANRYVPRPPDDLLANGGSRPPSIVLSALPVTAPLTPRFWRAHSDDPAVWLAKPQPAPLTLLKPPLPPAGVPAMATIYVPNPPRDEPWIAASQDMPINLRTVAAFAAPFLPAWDGNQSLPSDPVWAGESGSATWLLTQQPAVTAAPFLPNWPGDYDASSDAKWTGQPGRATWLLAQTLQLYVPGSTRVIPFEDAPPWVRKAAPANYLLLQSVITAPFVPTRWDYDVNDASVAYARSTPLSAMLLPQPQIKPFTPATWDQHLDDPAVQNRAQPVAPVLGLVGGNYPIVPPRWGIPGDDAPPALIRSVPTSAVLRKLAAGSVVIPARWKFDYDDASFRPGGKSAPPSRGLFDLLVANVPFKPVYSMPGIDDPVVSVHTLTRGALSLPLSIILDLNYIARGDVRNRTVLGASNQMSSTNTLQPPIDADVEIETVTFDFGRIVPAGTTITGLQSLTCVVWKAVVDGAADSAPQSRLVGPAVIVASPNSGQPSQAVSQLVGTMVAGLVYRLQCVVTMSDGQVLSLWTHLECDAPN